jgi:glycosidase
MYKVYLFVFSFLFAPYLYSQLIVTNPAFPKENESVLIYFDASQGTAGLKDCACNIYIHTGVITDKSTSSSDWKYVPTTWGVVNTNWQMKPVPGKSNLYSFEITPSIRSFYKVPSAEKILKLAFVFRNANGNKEGKDVGAKDIFYPVFQNSGLTGVLEEPTSAGKLLNPSTPFLVKAMFSSEVDISLFDNDSLIYRKNGLDLTFQWVPDKAGFHQVIILAKTGNGDSMKLETHFLVVPEPKRQEAPPNTAPGFQRISPSKIRISVEAPGIKHLFLLGEFNEWKLNTNYLFNLNEKGSMHWIEVDSIPQNKPFLYQLALNENQRFADPYAPLVLDPVHDKFITPSTFAGLPLYPVGKTSGIVTCIDSTLHKYEWKNKLEKKTPASDLLIYELHLRDFFDAPNYKKLKDTLAYLVRLGVNAIELMPVNEFEGNNSWGYNPSYHLALDKYYGSPVFFKMFIDECHKNGIAVIIDIVLNHAFSQSPLCKLFWDDVNSRPSADNPWFNQVAKHDFNVGYDFNHESNYTRDFSKRVMTYWLNEYHIDGFRFDLSKGFTQKNTLGNTNAWGVYDPSRVAIWQDYSDHIRKINPAAWIILEHFADPVEELELAKRGMLLWGNMNYQFNEATMGYPSNLSGLDYKKRNFLSPALIQYMESHDEERLMVRNSLYGKKTDIYDTRKFNTALRRMEMAYTLFSLSPGPKMIWQFGELGYDYSINTCEDGSVNNNCRLSPKPIPWSLLNQSGRKRLFDVVSSLNKLRSNYEVFKEIPFAYDLTSFLKYMHYKNGQFDALVIANTNVEAGNLKVQNLKTGWWYGYFSGDSIRISENNFDVLLKPGEYELYTTIRLPAPASGFITTSNKDLFEENVDIVLFPNPTDRFINFNYNGPKLENVSLVLIDVTGKQLISLIYNETIENGYFNQFDLKDYPVGIYFLNLFSKESQKTFLLSKNY